MREDQADSGAAGQGDEPRQPGSEHDPGAAGEDAGGLAPPVFDEDFVRSARIREPSARARGMAPVGPHPDAPTRAPLSETLSQPARAHRSPARPSRISPISGADPRHLAAILVAVAVMVGAVYFVAGRGTLFGGGEPASKAAAAGGSTPATPDSTSAPFAGTPAAAYQDGAAGIELPRATASAGFNAAQVASALRAAKALLVATNLEPATLRGEHPDAFLALLDPKETMLQETVRDALAHPTGTDNVTLWTTRFDPREATLLAGQPVKVHGTMSFAPADDGLRVHTDYLFVYALRAVRTRSGENAWTRVVVRRTLDVDLVDTSRFVATPGTIRLREHSLDFSNATCGPYDGFIHPFFGTGASGGPTPSGSPVDPYDQSKPLDGARQDSCGMVSRV